jgi:hypothetical protein
MSTTTVSPNHDIEIEVRAPEAFLTKLAPLWAAPPGAMGRRTERQNNIDAGQLPDFPPETARIRNDEGGAHPARFPRPSTGITGIGLCSDL